MTFMPICTMYTLYTCVCTYITNCEVRPNICTSFIGEHYKLRLFMAITREINENKNIKCPFEFDLLVGPHQQNRAK